MEVGICLTSNTHLHTVVSSVRGGYDPDVNSTGLSSVRNSRAITISHTPISPISAFYSPTYHKRVWLLCGFSDSQDNADLAEFYHGQCRGDVH